MHHTPHTNTCHTRIQFESEATSLKASLESTLRDLEEVQSSSQHRVRQLTQQLETARVAIQELEGAQDHCSELEREVAEVRGALNSKDTEICQLELVSGLYSHPLSKLCSTSPCCFYANTAGETPSVCLAVYAHWVGIHLPVCPF